MTDMWNLFNMDGSDSGVHSYETNVVKIFQMFGGNTQAVNTYENLMQIRVFTALRESGWRTQTAHISDWRRACHPHTPDPATLQALSAFAQNACSRLSSSVPLCLFAALSRDAVVQGYDKDVV